MPNSALFLDRDGVINVDHGYVHRPDQFEFVPGIFELARFWTNEVQRPIVVITNQSGIGRGYFDQNAYAALTRWMCDRFEAEGTAISRVYHCPHHPVEGLGEYRRDHPWRKPNPGMLLQAVSDLGLDPVHCAIVGDKMSDMEAGAGCAGRAQRGCLMRTNFLLEVRVPLGHYRRATAGDQDAGTGRWRGGAGTGSNEQRPRW